MNPLLQGKCTATWKEGPILLGIVELISSGRAPSRALSTSGPSRGSPSPVSKHGSLSNVSPLGPSNLSPRISLKILTSHVPCIYVGRYLVVFVKIKNLKHPKCQRIGNYLNELWYGHTMEYLIAIKIMLLRNI